MDIIIENTRAGSKDLHALASNMPDARCILIKGCHELTDLEPLAMLTQLRVLHVIDCSSLRDIKPIAPLKALHGLKLTSCVGVADLSPIAEHRDLHVLDVAGCANLNDLTPLRNLHNLRALDLRGLVISDLTPLFALRWLQRVHISPNSGIPVEQLMELTHWLRNCTVIES
jgi:Leucine-rich repeat (LRR) protein